MSDIHFQITNNHSDKPYLVLLHGLFGDLDNLSSIKRGLQDCLNIISFDLPDHGKSARTTQFSFATYAQKIIQVLDQQDINQPHILGHSLGGKIAMEIALTHPQKVASLVVADIAPVSYSPRHENVINALQNVDLAQLQSRGDADKMLAEFLTEPGVRQFLLKGLVRVEDKWHWRFNLARLTQDYSKLSQGLQGDRTFKRPTLFIKGGKSDYLTAQHQPIIQSLFPASQAKIISSAGHWLHAENPTVFNRLVKNFLEPLIH